MQAAQKVTTDFVLEDSFLITNVGRFALPESCRPYVLDYGAILPCAVQPFALLISSYGDKMKLSVARATTICRLSRICVPVCGSLASSRRHSAIRLW